jgi:hypothetical protein
MAERIPKGWVQQQVEQGKGDDEILGMLARKGWDPKDARLAILDAHRQPVSERISAAEKIIFALAVAGIALAVYLIDLRRIIPQETTAAVNLAAAVTVAFAILLLGWVLYELSIKHNHPKLHKIFFLYCATVAGTAAYIWLMILALRIAAISGIVISTLAAICAISMVFALSVVANEYSYNRLRQRYDHTPPKHAGRMAIAAIIIFAICAATIAISAHWAFSRIISIANERNAQAALELRDRAQGVDLDMLSSAGNPILREQFSRQAGEFDTKVLQPSPLPQPLLSEFLLDSYVSRQCGSVTGVLRFATMSEDIALAQRYAEYEATGAKAAGSASAADVQEYQRILAARKEKSLMNVALPVRLRLAQDLQSCVRSYEHQTYKALPENPDLNDPAQRDLVQFIIWTEQHPAR